MDEVRVRIDRVLSVLKVFPSRTKASQFVRDNMILINDSFAKPSSYCQSGDIVTIYLPNKVLKFVISLEKKDHTIYVSGEVLDDNGGPILTC